MIDPSLPATSGFGTFESFKLIVWGHDLAETEFTGKFFRINIILNDFGCFQIWLVGKFELLSDQKEF